MKLGFLTACLPDRSLEDIATWAVPFGIIGGRIYHVITSPQAYFGEGGEPWRAFAAKACSGRLAAAPASGAGCQSGLPE